MSLPSTFSEHCVLPPLDSSLPRNWFSTLVPFLRDDETLLTYFETDLDDQLSYVDGIVLLTSRRLLVTSPSAQAPAERATPDSASSARSTSSASSTSSARSISWESFDVTDDARLVRQDYSGVGALELFNARARVAVWRYTLGRDGAAGRLINSFERLQARRRSATEGSLAPDGGAPPTAFAEHGNSPHGDADADADPETQSPPSTWVLFRLWRFARPYRWRLFAGFLLSLASTGATLVPPYLTMPLMDKILIPYQNGHPIDTGQVTFYLTGLFGAALVAWALGWARTYILAWVSERIGADLRIGTYEHLLKLSQEYFGGKRTGDLIARIGSETDRINVFISLHFLDFATDVLMITMTTCILVSINPSLALVTLIPLPVIAWMIHTVREKLRLGFERVDRIWAEITNVLADTIPGIRVVKAFAQEKREAERFRTANRHNLEGNDKVNRVWSLFGPTVTLLTEVGVLVVWAFGIWQISKDEITVGVLTAFIAYIGRFYTRLDSMSRIVSVTQKAAAGAKRIFDVLDHVSNVPEPEDPVRLEAVEGRIELRDAGFRYGTRNVIRHLNLAIEPGEMIGLVGHSGSGKSTLINLICRFYDLAEGAILVDGVDIRALPIAEYRKNIGLVLQEPFLFFGTIAENIAYGKPDATREQIVAAARAAHAHEFILRLPHAYDSLVGERGQSLSGGERQRISIARALLIDPKILILDEATSSVDSTTEKEIQRALDNLVHGRTTIAIAHRLSTLRKASRLVVLDRGEIVETGDHDALMESQGHYYRLYQTQKQNAEQEEDQ